jgi:hypothetical protein
LQRLRLSLRGRTEDGRIVASMKVPDSGRWTAFGVTRCAMAHSRSSSTPRLLRSRVRLRLAAVLAVALASCNLADPWRPEREHYRRNARIGMAETEVRSHLGVPQFEYTAATAPNPYYVKGYSHEERAISNKVLIYIGTEPICYVYVNDSDRVEHVFVGGS